MHSLAKLALFSLLVILPGQASTAQNAQVEPEIATLIAKLGSPSFLTREEATRQLWMIGEPARPYLVRAQLSSDREVVARSQLILDRLSYGLQPDTPIETVALIEQYRTGDFDAKRSAIQQLIQQRRYDLLERFIQLADTPGSLEEVGKWILGTYDESLIPLITHGDHQQVTQLLLQIASARSQITTTTRLLAANDELDRGISFIEQLAVERASTADQEQAPSFTAREQRLLASLYRANGETQRALQMIDDPLEREQLERNTLTTGGEWNTLSDKQWAYSESLDADAIRIDVNNIDEMAFSAVIHHYANQTERCDRVIESLRHAASENPAILFDVAECLFTVDRYDDAINLIIQRNATDGFDLLCDQQRYEEAFLCLGISIDEASIRAWYEPILRVENLTDPQGTFQLYQSLDVAAQLAELGERSLSRECFSRLAEIGLQDTGAQFILLREVTRRQFLLGFEQDAWDQLRRLFMTERFRASDPLRGDFGLRCLMPADYVLAGFWWVRLEPTLPDALDRLARIKQLLDSRFDDHCGDESTLAILDQAIFDISQLEESQRYRGHLLFADSCQQMGLRSLAIEHYRYAHELGDTSSALRLGDLYFEQQDYVTAANWYETAFRANSQLAIAGYLHGHCLTLSSHADIADDSATPTQDRSEAERIKQRAVLVSLLNTHSNSLADSLANRGMHKDAAAIWHLIANVDTPMTEASLDAHNRLAGQIANERPLEAAELWELAVLGRLAERNLLAVFDYLRQAEFIHHARATASLGRGDVDQAWDHILRCRAAQPGSTRVAEDFVPQLEALGEQDKADTLFSELYDHYTAILERFPNSALHHNNLAWFTARCGRRLDDAMYHATLASQLQPDSDSYLDTLAEVSFLQGDLDQAISLAKRCIEINSTKSHYREQLQRFEAAKLASGN